MEPYPTPNLIKQDLLKILNEISFVDKIVFGKWSYNGITSYFSDNKNFYNDASYEVIKFCRENDIKCHIKKGTIDEKHINKRETASSEYKKLLLRYKFA